MAIFLFKAILTFDGLVAFGSWLEFDASFTLAGNTELLGLGSGHGKVTLSAGLRDQKFGLDVDVLNEEDAFSALKLEVDFRSQTFAAVFPAGGEEFVTRGSYLLDDSDARSTKAVIKADTPVGEHVLELTLENDRTKLS